MSRCRLPRRGGHAQDRARAPMYVVGLGAGYQDWAMRLLARVSPSGGVILHFSLEASLSRTCRSWRTVRSSFVQCVCTEQWRFRGLCNDDFVEAAMRAENWRTFLLVRSALGRTQGLDGFGYQSDREGRRGVTERNRSRHFANCLGRGGRRCGAERQICEQPTNSTDPWRALTIPAVDHEPRD
jgi:hypothetical protein